MPTSEPPPLDLKSESQQPMRSPVSSIPKEYLDPIQRGTLNYSWKGIPCLKNPFDLALYTMLLWQAKPRTIFEIGSNAGGSAIWFADMLYAMGLDAKIISIDIERPEGVSHPDVEFRQGNALRLWEVLPESELYALPRPFLVIEDASHAYEVSLACLEFFDRWLQPGEYMCVEDGIISSFAVEDRYNGGPDRAIREFLETRRSRYTLDTTLCDYFGYNVTWNTNGFLQRVHEARGETVNRSTSAAALTSSEREMRYGDHRALLSEVTMLNSRNLATSEIETLEDVSVRVKIEPVVDVPDAVIGMLIRNASGMEIYGVDSLQSSAQITTDLKAGQTTQAVISFRNVLARGSYFLTLAIAEKDSTKLDVRMDAFAFSVRDQNNAHPTNLANLEARFSVDRIET